MHVSFATRVDAQLERVRAYICYTCMYAIHDGDDYCASLLLLQSGRPSSYYVEESGGATKEAGQTRAATIRHLHSSHLALLLVSFLLGTSTLCCTANRTWHTG